jgi:hypothetical protein
VLRAKTGTLGNVASVTGYLGRPEGVLVISMLYNGARPTTAREEQWRLFRMLGANGTLVPIGVEVAESQWGGEAIIPPVGTPPTP